MCAGRVAGVGRKYKVLRGHSADFRCFVHRFGDASYVPFTATGDNLSYTYRYIYFNNESHQ